MKQQLPDIQASVPDVQVGLNQVGVTDVEKLVKIARPNDRPIILMAEFDVFVDLPRQRKGIDMSRNMEVINETIEEAVSTPAYRVVDVCGDVADRLLEKHDYTTETRVEMEAEYMIKDKTPTSNQQTQGTVDILASASAEEGRETREEIGARVTGITVCPCSQEMMNSRAEEKLTQLGLDADEVEDFLQTVPQAGHAQRGHTTLTIETAGRPEVDLENVIAVARDAMSAKIYNLAKRSDEDAMTHRAHMNAKFVEDCVRSLAEDVVDTFDHLPDDAVITMMQKNEESIHQHNAQAERVAELGTLRDEIKD